MIRLAASLAVLAVLAPQRAPDVDVRALSERELQLFVGEGPLNAAFVFRQAEAHLAELPPVELERARAAARRVVERCPYNGATVQLVATLNAELEALARITGAWAPPTPLALPGDSRSEPGMAQRIRDLRDWTRALTALDRRLGVAPAEPQAPAEVSRLLSTVRARAEGLDPEARTAIAADLAIARAATLPLWNDTNTFTRLHELLREAGRAARDVAARTDHPEAGHRAGIAAAKTKALGALVLEYPMLFA